MRSRDGNGRTLSPLSGAPSFTRTAVFLAHGFGAPAWTRSGRGAGPR